jgi:hypothetical protein
MEARRGGSGANPRAAGNEQRAEESFPNSLKEKWPEMVE